MFIQTYDFRSWICFELRVPRQSIMSGVLLPNYHLWFFETVIGVSTNAKMSGYGSAKLSLLQHMQNVHFFLYKMFLRLLVTRMLSQPLIFEEETLTPTIKHRNFPESQLATYKNMGSLLNKALIYKSTIPNSLKNTRKFSTPVKTGWTWNHLDHILILHSNRMMMWTGRRSFAIRLVKWWINISCYIMRKRFVDGNFPPRLSSRISK